MKLGTKRAAGSRARSQPVRLTRSRLRPGPPVGWARTSRGWVGPAAIVGPPVSVSVPGRSPGARPPLALTVTGPASEPPRGSVAPAAPAALLPTATAPVPVFEAPAG